MAGQANIKDELKLNQVLIIDDDDINNFISESIIEVSGVAKSSYTCSTARKALDYLQTLRASEPESLPDAILLDISMPQMNGWEFLDKLKETDILKQKKTVIAMLTSSVYPEDISRAKRYKEVSEYISKPLTEEKMHSFFHKYFPERNR